jgi:hypothetical protein
MSYRDGEDNNIMKAFFRGNIKKEDLDSKSRLVEIGHGIGIGHTGGSYSTYIIQLSKQSKDGNGAVYLGKEINEDKGKMSIVGATKKFDIGNVPKLLVMFHNVVNGIMLKVEWKDTDNDTILEQYYQIPQPHSMKYDWWDMYSTYFIGPEGLEEGNYNVKISSNESSKSKKTGELSTNIEFSVIE